MPNLPVAGGEGQGREWYWLRYLNRRNRRYVKRVKATETLEPKKVCE